MQAVAARSTFRSENAKTNTGSDHEASFCVAGARDSAPCQK